MSLKVLTVDDSKTIRMIVRKAFRPFDCEVFEGENGVEGLAAAVREKPDLIVLDITMPVMDGKEMLAKLKGESSLKDIPVIMLTAEAGKDNVTEIVKMGVNDYMVKPFKGGDLIERVTKLVKLEPKKADEAAKPEKEKSKSLFTIEDGIQYLVFPAAVNQDIISKVLGCLKSDIVMSTEAGKNKLILNLSELSKIGMSIIKLIIKTIEKCQETQTHLRVIGNPKLVNELKDFQETAELRIYSNVKDALASF